MDKFRGLGNTRRIMGKAGKWIRNYLMGKKEEKHKKIDASIDNNTANMASQMKVPKVKRRWSFGRIRGKVEAHKVSRSFNSSDSAKQQIQAIVETETPKNSPRDNENVAATKIQSAFRSYLARKALHALRGLVKIQALVRGHLVRKQTSATLRGMHALMTIQVRARIQRIHMAEEAKLHVGKQSWQRREIPHNRGLVREYKDSKDTSIREMLGVLKSRSGPLDHLLVKSTEHDSMALAFPFYSRHLSVSKRGRRDKENALITAPNSPEHYQIKALSTSQRHSVSNDHLLAPNYMTNTQSSWAKTRSQSEPKERPKRGTRQKNKPMESRNEFSTSLDGRRQYLSLNSSRSNHGSLDHWIIKDTKFDSFSSSTVTTDSNP